MELLANLVGTLEVANKTILHWVSTASEEARERMIFDGDRYEIDQYLQAVDEIQRSMESAMMTDHRSKANSAIQIAMTQLNDKL
ncbi:hypothetical protein U1Q18_047919 [Sarracenia purpurea var. burkii]